jgi:hypothetical protein
MSAVCCSNETTTGQPLDLELLAWVLAWADSEDIALTGMVRVDGAWCEVSPHALLELGGVACRISQRLGCLGIRTRVDFGPTDTPIAGLFTTATPEPSRWRVLLLEALVLQDHESVLAAK